MKILFDHQIFSSQRFGGISRYHVELIKHLDIQWDIPVFFSNNMYLKELKKVPEFFPKKQFRGKNRILELINRSCVLSSFRKGDFDIFHPTFYGSYCLKYAQKRQMVLTVHDMIHDRFSQLPAAEWEKKEKYLMSHAAAAVIVPSRFTADELMSLYGIPSGKIHVVHHGAPHWRQNREKVKENCFLFVGGRGYYKNFSLVLNAMIKVPESTLLAVGPSFSKEEKALIANAGLTERITHISACEEELPSLYASSAAFIFSSKMEGFGLPVLESFASGCPVLLSDIPVFHEVAASAALYFDPDSPDSLADAMKQIMNKEVSFDLSGRLAEFSWQKCASETRAVYDHVINAH